MLNTNADPIRHLGFLKDLKNKYKPRVMSKGTKIALKPILLNVKCQGEIDIKKADIKAICLLNNSFTKR